SPLRRVPGRAAPARSSAAADVLAGGHPAGTARIGWAPVSTGRLGARSARGRAGRQYTRARAERSLLLPLERAARLAAGAGRSGREHLSTPPGSPFWAEPFDDSV